MLQLAPFRPGIAALEPLDTSDDFLMRRFAVSAFPYSPIKPANLLQSHCLVVGVLANSELQFVRDSVIARGLGSEADDEVVDLVQNGHAPMILRAWVSRHAG